nr:intracellular protein transport protein USO1-like isoform X2 [Ipomoea trifida]
MSWFRSAVIKAVEAGNKNNLNRFKTYADTVVQQAGLAVAEGAKIFQDRIGNRNFKSFKQTVKRLEEASVSCRGPERVHLMRRWLAALKVIKEIEELSGTPIEDNERSNEQQYPSEGPTESSRKQSMVLYYDSDVGGEPMNFRDVFLYSQALEGVSICMILEAPNEEEISLLLELFGLCLTGGKEVHNAIISSIQDLAKVFLGYEDEVLVKRDELLQFAEGAITGLKINADLGRIDAEVSTLKKRLEIREKKESVNEGHKTISQETATTVEVDKLKILCESLASSSSKAERKISDQRAQREDALRFRVAKASEVSEIEKELSVEISALEKQRDELEAQLKQVKISLAAVNGRLRNAREERDQFYEANDQIVAHLRTKEDELSKVISSCRVEGNVLSTWINFMEDTWALQCSYTDAKRKEAIDELEGHEDYFVNLVIQLLSAYERDLKPSIDRIEKYVENLKSLGTGSVHDDSRALNPRNNLEEEYLDYETKIITTFSVVDNMREQYYAQQGKISRKDDSKVKDLFDNIEKLRTVFESIERPNLEMETPDQEAEISSSENPHENVSHPTKEAGEIPDVREKEHSKSPATNVQKQEPSTPKLEHVLDAEAELAQLESEFGKVNPDYSAEEIGDWEFDELERELRSGDSATNK